MPTLPLYDPSPATPDAWHRVVAPGGYEWWYFDAEGEGDADVQVVAIFLEGFVFHPGYLRRYARYLRNPTRARPPVPSDFPCVYFVVYEKGRILAQFMSQFAPEHFAASSDRVDVRVGPNRLTSTAGELRLSLRGTPWELTWQGPRLLKSHELSADLTFRPRLAVPPLARTFLSRQLAGGAEHHWVVANPWCDVSGMVRIEGHDVGAAAREIAFRGKGYHDHNYGTAPIGPGLRRWIWGRVLLDDRVLTFHFARPRDPALPDEIHLIEGDAGGLRAVDVTAARLDWSRRTGTGLAYPSEVRLGEALHLTGPRVIDASPFYLRLTYEVRGVDGREAKAFCEVAYPNRLRWPVLGRMIELSIHRPG